MSKHGKRQWLTPTGLIFLSLVPVLAGAARLGELSSGAAETARNARFVESPLPVTLHIVGATVFCLVGALQFVPSLRSRPRRWHRLAGRSLVPFGLLAALSGLWMTLFYPRPPADDQLLEGFRLVFGSLMVVSLVLGVVAVRQRDFARHRAWMMRGYAIGIAAGTQALLFLPLAAAGFNPVGLPRALVMGAAWVINLAVAQWFIQRRPAGSAGRPVRPRVRPVTEAGIAR